MAIVISIDGVDGAGKTTFLDQLSAHFSDQKIINVDREVYPIWKSLHTNSMPANVRALFYYALMKRKQDIFQQYKDQDAILIVERYGYTSQAFNKAAAKQDGALSKKPSLSQEQMDSFIQTAANDLEKIAVSGMSFHEYVQKNFSSLLEHDVLTQDYYTNSQVLAKPSYYVFLYASDHTILQRVSEKSTSDPHEKDGFLLPYNAYLRELYNQHSANVVFLDTDKIAKEKMMEYVLNDKNTVLPTNKKKPPNHKK